MTIICSQKAMIFFTEEFDNNKVKYQHTEKGINHLKVEDTPKSRLAIQLAKGKGLKFTIS